MKRETITYKGKKYHRLPKSPRRQANAYYWRHDSYKSPQSLHRQLWLDNFGKIPKGFVVHHKDENTLNNELSNLMIMPKSEHSRMHNSTPKAIKKAKYNLAKFARKKAMLWHKSPEAIAWKKKRNSKGQFTKKI